MKEVGGRPAASVWVDVALAVVLAIAAHAPALHGTGFTIDDHTIVEQNARLVVEHPADLVPLLAGSYWGEDYREERLWRPVVLASFALDRALLGPHPDGYHRVSVALHALASALALLLCRRLLPRSAALTAALLFAVHPVHAEATAGLVGRSEVLGLVFGLLGMLLHLRARDLAAREPSSGRLRVGLRWLAPALAFVLGFGAKEAALTAPFILFVVERVARAPLPVERARRHGPYALYALAIVVYFVARAVVLGGILPSAETQSIGTLPLTTRVLVAALVARDAIRAVLAPPPTAALYPFHPPLRGTADFGLALVAIVVHLALLAFAVTLLRGRSRVGATLGLGVLAFYMSLGPTSNLIPIGVVFAERLLYAPSLWAIIAVTAAALPALRRDRALWSLVLGLALGACAYRLVESARAWTDEALVWASTLERFRDEPVTMMAKAHESYARALIARGELEDALPHVVNAVEGAPSTGTNAAAARALLGSVFHSQGRLTDAAAVLEEARALAPKHATTLAELAAVQLSLADAAPPELRGGKLLIAERTAREGTRAAPQSYWLWLQWGTILSRLDGREADAEAAYDRAIERRSAPWEALANRALIRDARGALEEALADDRRACAILLSGPLPREASVTLIKLMVHRVRLGQRLGQPDAEARAWLGEHQPAVLQQLDARG